MKTLGAHHLLLITVSLYRLIKVRANFILPRNRSEEFPQRVIVGYANWQRCDDNALTAAIRDGVNVVIWSSLNIFTLGNSIEFKGGDQDCVRQQVRKFKDLGLTTFHLISIGGWNSPHPGPSTSYISLFNAWKIWNNDLFDGLDWNIEVGIGCPLL